MENVILLKHLSISIQINNSNVIKEFAKVLNNSIAYGIIYFSKPVSFAPVHLRKLSVSNIQLGWGASFSIRHRKICKSFHMDLLIRQTFL